MAFRRAALACAAAAVAGLTVARADEATHIYAPGEAVTVWLNKVGPYHNPQETYSFYSLPYCRPDSGKLSPETRLGGLGEILEGQELQNSDLPVAFGEDVANKPICKLTLDEAGAQLFAYAVSNHYWYQLFLDELPVWGMVGEVVADEDVIREIESHIERPHGIAESTFLYTHKNFTVAYNGEHVIEVNMTSEGAVPIEAGRSYEMTYSVHWVATDKPFARRFERYLDGNFFEHQIHWFSLFNSFMMVVFLCGLVALILMRTLRADYARYMADEDDVESSGGVLDKTIGDESGWKQVHGDVFRRPSHLVLFSALIGTGTQLILLGLVVIAAAFAGSLYVDRGAVFKAGLVGYGLTSAVSGFFSGRFYRSRFAPEPSPDWIKVMLLTAVLFPGLLFTVTALLNSVALGYGTTNYLTFGTLLKVILLWALISLPLTVGGTIVGRRFGSAAPPARVNPIPRPIPARPWYWSAPFLAAMAGVLPFGSIFIETYYVLTSFWNYKFYYVYGFMLVVSLILFVVTSCCTVVGTYLLLSNEDHRWQWHALASGASTAGYVFLYAVYYFLVRTEMTGLLQTAYYFGYTTLACAAIGLATGTVGYAASSVFVRSIYSNIKLD